MRALQQKIEKLVIAENWEAAEAPAEMLATLGVELNYLAEEIEIVNKKSTDTKIIYLKKLYYFLLIFIFYN
ncbi:MAG: hypothetical protein LBR09_02200 [Endomicrobium sp.]|jgi:hypothetical protein|nr:hypothetical protein [Endomicrobium sp.]